MASPGVQPSWVPYETIKDCSQGFCSIYCPQWCYIIFPPPPPFGFSDDASSGPNLSPLVIAVIGILASAFLLVGYYTLISRYCGRLDSLRRRLGRDTPGGGGGADEGSGGGALRHDGWYTPASGGLEESVIKSIGVFKYRRGEGLVNGADCSVCLGEFRDDESLRLLPKCSHAFHVACIDTWLKSHDNCPLCRAHIVSPCTAAAAPSPPPPPPPPILPSAPLEPQSTPPLPEIRQDEEPEWGRDVEEAHPRVERRGASATKTPTRVHSELGLGGLKGRDAVVDLGDDGVQPIRRSFSMDATRLTRVSVADVLGMDMESDFGAASAAKEDLAAMAEEGGSSRGYITEQHACKAGGRSRALHCVLSPVPMKRSFSSGRFCFTGRQGRGNHGDAILPL